MGHLNSDLLCTFLAVAQTGSMTEGAVLVFRSQSAASLQIRKLEEILGKRVFERHGRGVVLTETGERLLPTAIDVTQTLDATLRDLTSDGLNGKLRLGIPDDQSKETLSQIIGAFAQSHPRVELEVTCTLSAGFPEAIASGALDLAIYETANPSSDEFVLKQEKTCWMISRHHDLLARDFLPVALFDRDCWWRDAAIESLHTSDRPFRVVYSSQSVSGVQAAVEAGIGVGLMGQTSKTKSLRQLELEEGFGETPVSNLVLGAKLDTVSAPVQTMKEAIKVAFSTS